MIRPKVKTKVSIQREMGRGREGGLKGWRDGGIKGWRNEEKQGSKMGEKNR